MYWWQALILGIIQGLTEFLPVSSSGHLLVAQDFMFGAGETDFLLFDILLHVSTLFAVVAVFYKDIFKLFKPPFKTLGWIALATVPAGITGVLVWLLVRDQRAFLPYLWIFFLITAALLLTAELIGKRVRSKEAGFTLKNAVCMGLMQALAPLPGISRSGTTLFGGAITNGRRTDVARFSFLMSMPIILASLTLELFSLRKPESLASAASIPWFGYALAMAAAFGAGLAVIKLMLRLIAKANFKWFALYLVGLSVFSFVYYFILG